MARVRRVIRKKKWLRRSKSHHMETQTLETRTPVQHDFQVKAVNQPPIEVEQAHRKPATDYVSLAIKAAKAFYQKTSLDHIDKVAEGLFTFDVDPHVYITMPDIVAQEIFSWIITLSEQPMDEKEKLRLARKFIVSLAPVSSPVEKPAEL